MPPEMGAALVQQMLRVSQKVRGMSEGERTLWAAEQHATVERMAGGPDGLKAKLADAASVLAMGGPGPFREAMGSGPVFHDAWVLLTLANWGSRVNEWMAKYPRNR
jgi:hypothetical protein